MKKILWLVLIGAPLLLPMIHAQTIRVDMVNQDPDPVRAGDVVEVRFKVENTWEDTRDDVKVEIMPDYPFTMYQSENIHNLGRLEGNQMSADATIVDFKIRVDKDAQDGKNELKVNLYQGAAKWEFKDKFFINVKHERISIQPYISASDLTVSGNKGKVTIEVANTGNNKLERLQLKLLDAPDYKLLSTSNYVYLGDLDIDDTQSEDFEMYVNEGMKEVNIPVELSYQVDKNEYTQKFDLHLNLLTKEEAKKLGVIKTSYTPYVIGGIILLFVVIFFIRKLRNR